MRYLLDTSAAVWLIRGEPARARTRFRRVARTADLLAIGSVAVFELHYGVARSSDPQTNAERLSTFLSGSVDVVPLTGADAAEAASLRARLAADGQPIGPYDVLIAGQALRLDATLVTGNGREFSRVPGLRVQDWSQPPAR
ncbi:MAG: PIN domain-containing protein [Angustibacter sp.]